MGERPLTEGDIYRWHWKPEVNRGDYPYWCKSQKATFSNGILRDTYWYDGHEGALRPSEVVLTLLGNVADFDEVRVGEERYFADADIIDMRHSNNSSGPVYVRKGAKRCAEKMRERAIYKRSRAQGEIVIAQSTIERMDAVIALIDAGKLDEVYL